MLDFDDSIYDDCISGMALKAHCNKSYKPSSYDLSCDSVVEHGDVWFVKRDFLQEFFSVLPIGCSSISVVTQHSDYEVDDSVMELKPSCVKKVFGSNTTSRREDAVPVPLGLGPPYCTITPKAEHIRALDTKKIRSHLLYVNFRVSTYPQERQAAFQSMQRLSEICHSVTIATQASDPTIVHGYLNDMIDHKFCLCPRGNGIDTHRLWEALYCRTVPVVKYEHAHRNFLDLPILFVDDWNQVTEEYLHTQYEQMLHREWDYSKLKASWWGKQFKE
jgi:hypothetical protein